MKDNKQKTFITIGIVIVCLITLAFSIPFIKFINDPEALRSFINSFGVFSSLAYIVLTTIQILIPFIPGEPFEILAGYAFGSFKGSLLCIVAEAIGSILAILIIRKLGRKFVEYYFSKEDIDKLSFLKSKKAFIYYAIIFIIPGTPKDLLCFFGGLSEFDLMPLMIVTTIGRLPAILTSTIAGGALGDKQYLFSFILTIITAIISAIGLFIYNKISKKKA